MQPYLNEKLNVRLFRSTIRCLNEVILNYLVPLKSAMKSLLNEILEKKRKGWIC